MRCVFLLDGAFLFEDIVLETGFLHCLREEAWLARAVESDVLSSRLAEGKGRREIARAVLIELRPALLIRRIARGVGNVGVDGRAVGRDDAAQERGGAHAALDFEREDARLDEFRNRAVHAHILERELVGAGAAFVETLAALLVDELIGPAAGLEAATAVAALTEDDAGVDALAALGDAHVAMHEVFDLDACARTEKCELGKRHLAADDDARNAVLLELLYGVLVVRVHHDGGVQRDGDAHLMYEFEHGEVLHEQSVWLDFFQIQKIFFQSG